MKRLFLALLLLGLFTRADAQLYPLGPNVGTLEVPYNDGSGNWAALSLNGSGSVCMTVSCSMTTPNLGTPSALVLTNATSLPCAAMPALTGSVISSAGSCTTTGAIATKLESAQTATIAETILCNDTSGLCNVAGAQYMVSWTIWGSGTACSSTTAGQVTLALYWTDEQSTAHAGVIMAMQTQTSATAIANNAFFKFETALANEGASGQFVLSSNGAAPIEFGQVYTACTTGTGTFNTRIAVTRLQ